MIQGKGEEKKKAVNFNQTLLHYFHQALVLSASPSLLFRNRSQEKIKKNGKSLIHPLSC